MSGHSKWATIKRKKGALDAKRGQAFTKIIREITVAAKNGGGDPGGNPRLRLAIDKAKSNNMPAKNIENAIAKGTGQLEGVNYEEVTYEGYGPQGVAVFLEVLTDNRNRTVSEIRNLLTKNGGNLGESGSVAWIFKTMGLITVDAKVVDEDTLMETVLEAGAEDMENDGDTYEIKCPPDKFDAVKKVLEAKKIPIIEAEITKVPQNTIKLEGAAASKMVRLMETMEDHDDVQNAYANFDIDEKEMTQLAG
ncbi:MAG: YebC/PmpR family DNA-binding transcriptional regulator [Fibrobacterota bacterium]